MNKHYFRLLLSIYLCFYLKIWLRFISDLTEGFVHSDWHLCPFPLRNLEDTCKCPFWWELSPFCWSEFRAISLNVQRLYFVHFWLRIISYFGRDLSPFWLRPICVWTDSCSQFCNYLKLFIYIVIPLLF